MDLFKKIYATKAIQYDQLVSREDYQGHILPAIQQIRPLADQTIVELGAGTGRMTRLLGSHVLSILSMDISPHMLDTAKAGLSRSRLERPAYSIHLAVADNRRLPVAAETADLALAGWSLGHFVSWYPDKWREEIGKALAEMRRVLKPGGTIIILETLGTGRETPAPPTPGLAAYYQWLEDEHRFTPTWMRTDYQFISVAEADKLTRFFFGDALADQVCRQQLTILPECTGIWWWTP